MEKCDVAIVGGGIAGLSIAKFLAEKGIPFILLEEDNQFFKKPCGEGAIRYTVGYDFYDLYDSREGVEKEIWKTAVYTKYGEIDMEMPIVMLDKEKVEKHLAEKGGRGGEIRMGERAEKIEDGIIYPQKIKPKILVGADGVFSVVRKYAGIKKPKCGMAVEGYAENISMDDEKCHVLLRGDVVKRGYAWYFPKKNRWNIGIGSEKKKYFKEGFEKFKKENNQVNEWRGAYVPLDKPCKSHWKNVILLGDAASHVYSAIGAGITPSMIIASIAADFIEKWSKNDFMDIDSSLFEREWRKRIGKYLTTSYYTKTLFFSVVKSEYLRYKLLIKMCRDTTNYYRKVLKD